MEILIWLARHQGSWNLDEKQGRSRPAGKVGRGGVQGSSGVLWTFLGQLLQGFSVQLIRTFQPFVPCQRYFSLYTQIFMPWWKWLRIRKICLIPGVSKLVSVVEVKLIHYAQIHSIKFVLIPDVSKLVSVVEIKLIHFTFT